jgi:hypothetical protein
MKLTTYEFTARSGLTGYCKEYDPAGVRQMTGGKIKLTMTPTKSAGIMGPTLGYGDYVFTFSGRPDQMDPSAVFSIWLYDDATKDEIDVFEFSRWGDQNQPGNLHIGGYYRGKREGLATPLLFAPCRAFNSWYATLHVSRGGVSIIVYGKWTHDGKSEWKIVGSWGSTIPKDFVVGQVRAAMWVPPTGLKYTGSWDRGPMSMTLDTMIVSQEVPS